MSGHQPPSSDIIIEYAQGRRRRRLRCPRALIGVAGALFGLTALSVLGVGGYFIFRDDLLASLVARERQVQVAYEDRIAALRLRLDELAGRQFVDQDSVEGKVQSLALRQAQLETREAVVAQLVDHALAGGVSAVARASRNEPASTPRTTLAETAPAPGRALAPINGLGGLRLGDSAKPTPLPSSDALAPAPEKLSPSAALAPVADQAAPLPQRLDSLAASIDRVAHDQHRRLAGILRPALEQASRLRRVFDVAGVPVDRYLARARRHTDTGVGGPFVAAPDPDGAGRRFETDLALAQSAVATLDGLRRALPATPVRAPLAGPLQPTSSFGYRTDPFLGRPALHSGLDLRDDYGAPVRAAAGGVVVAAGPRGGYGNLVEIDHGGGMSTRYGHLSAIDVTPGEPVKPGAVIGRVGSTGRSTGPHLHYEVRVDGEAVDPARFLEAASLLERASK
jgi:hypothetical protein